MQQSLERFLKALRGMEVPVSPAESIDAHRAVALVGWSDRTLLRDALSTVVAKTPEEKERYFECFDAFFVAEAARGNDSAFDEDGAHSDDDGNGAWRVPPDDETEAGGADGGELASLLLAEDRAGMAAAMARAAGEVDLSRLRLFTQRGMFTRRILEEMGLRELEATIRELRASADGDPNAEQRAEQLEAGRDRLMEDARSLVERNIALYADPASEQLRAEFLQSMRLANLPARDFERVRRIVRRMAKRLASRHARRRFNQRDGRLDPRRTIRSNIAHDGLPFRLAWRYTRVERPKVVALCDVSGSVAAVAQFLLLLLHSLDEVLSDFHAFAFSSHLESVDDLLSGRRPFEEIVAAIMERIGFRPTDYGQTLLDLEASHFHLIDRRTTVIISGDARNNRGDARTEVMEQMFRRAKRVIWLNPEPRQFWGTGDSEMLRYLPYCHIATVCNTLRHLERTVDQILAARA